MCYVSYWGVKYTESFRDIIKDYSNVLYKVVLDPYGGSGGLIRIMLGFRKHVIYNDLNPIAYLIARYNIARNEEDIYEMRRCLIKVRSRLNEIADLYREYCPKCGTISDVAFRIHDDGAIVSYLKCGHTVDSSDVKLSKSLMPKWTQVELSYGDKSFLKAKRSLKLGDLFIGRGILVLSTLLEAISECPDAAKYVVLSIIYLLSRMAFLPRTKDSVIIGGKKWKPSWALPAYWLPRRFIEYNPLDIIDTKLAMLNHCKASRYKIGSVDEVLRGNAHIAFINTDADNLPLPDESVDIVTDPPYPTDIQYGELYFMFAILLGISNYNETLMNELVVNRNRGFTITDYLNKLSNHMAELYRVTRKNALFILKDSRYTKDITSVIGKYFSIREERDVNVSKRRSRIGDYRSQYRYVVMLCDKSR